MEEQLEAVNKAIELEGQSEALMAEAERLEKAIEELKEAKKREIEEIERRIEEVETTDRQYAEKLRERKHELQQKVRVLENLREIIHDSFPVTCAKATAANLALVATTAAILGNSSAHISPGIQSAANMLNDIAVGVVNTAFEVITQLAGIPDICALDGDPINMTTGNFIYSKEDITVPGRYPITFKRFYNAMGSFNGILGQGWTHNYNIRMFQNEENVHVVFDDGHVETYTRLDKNFYVSPLEHKNALTVVADEGYAFDLLLQNGIRYRFDVNGALRCIDDANANKTILDYDDAGILLEKVTTPSGSLQFKYNDDGRLVNVSDHTGRDVSFEYSNNLLTSATHPNGGVFKYEYDNRNSLQKVTNPIGVDTVWNRYDHEGRTVTQYLADDGVARLEYSDERMVTIFEEQNKNKIEYHRDEQYRTTKIVYADESSQCYDYDQQSNCIRYTDRNKNTYNQEYDSLGNMTSSIDPLGNKTTVEYNAHNEPTVVTRPNGAKITTVYDPYGNIMAIIDPIGRQMDIVGDEQGKVMVIVLPDGSENTFEYDERGNIIAMTDSQGVPTHYEYDALNRVVKSIDGEGAVTAYAYNARGDLFKVTNAMGNTRTYEYNLSGKVIKVIDFNGAVTEYRYNKIGKIEEIIDPVGGVTKLTYDIMWNVTSVTDPCGNVIRYEYDAYNRVVKSIDQEDNATTYTHDANGNVRTITNPLGATTVIGYDALDRSVLLKEPDGAITRTTYDSVGNVTEITDALGNTTIREYDLADQLIKVTDPLDNETHFTYTELGQPKTMTDAKGNKYSWSYYPGGRRKSVCLPCGETETFLYDRNGNIKTVTNALGNVTMLIRDSLGRVIEAINPLGHSKKVVYDAVDNITHITDENGHTTEYKYSLRGDVVEVIDATGHSTEYSYDTMSRLTEFRQYNNLGEAQITTYERNKKGEVVSVTSPLGDMVKYTYDRIGNVVAKQDEDNLETLYSYNLANELSKISYADGKTVELEYNALKQLTEMRDWLGTTSIELDAAGRATKVTDHEGNKVGYVWNALGQREKLIYPDGKEVSYEYTPSGKICKVLADTDVTAYTYDPLGRISERILPDGTTTKYEFNPTGALASLTHSKGNVIFDQFQYMHDPAGNIVQIDKHRSGIETDNGVFKYAYDPLNRLIEAINGVGVSKQYGYDPQGNRISSLLNGVETHHSFNARNQLIKTFENNNIIDYLYDKRGNMIQVTENDQLKATYTFDATNLMICASTQGKGNAEYAYNGFRNRIKKLEDFHNAQTATPDPTIELRYVLDMTLPYDNLLMTQGAHSQSFTWGNGLLSANNSEAINASTFYYLQDHLGSPIRLLGEDNCDSTMAYDEFGVSEIGANQTVQQGLHNPFGFTGYQADDISGLYYAQARFYNPTTGSFCAEDPIKDQFNWYGYCNANPLIFIDPSGLSGRPPGCVCNLNPCRCGGGASTQPTSSQPSSSNPSPSQGCVCGLTPCRCQTVTQPTSAPQANPTPPTVSPINVPQVNPIPPQPNGGSSGYASPGVSQITPPGERYDGHHGFFVYPFPRSFSGPSASFSINPSDGLEATLIEADLGMGIVGRETTVPAIFPILPRILPDAVPLPAPILGQPVNTTYVYLFYGEANVGLRLRAGDNSFVGFNIGAYAIRGSTELEFPIRGTNRNFVLGVQGDAGSIGARIAFENGRLKIGGSFGKGGGIIIGFPRRGECDE